MLQPLILRATAICLLTAYFGEGIFQALKMALMDDEALLRRTAVESIVPTLLLFSKQKIWHSR